MEKPFRVEGYYERKPTPKPKKAVREKIIKNSSKTDHVQHRGALWPEITPNATETAHLELLGGLGSAMCRNDPKLYQNSPFGTSERLGPKWSTTAGPKWSKTLPKLSETKHLSFKRDPGPGSANLALRKGWLEDASEREPPSRSLQPTQK